jgi:hypothetical protein
MTIISTIRNWVSSCHLPEVATRTGRGDEQGPRRLTSSLALARREHAHAAAPEAAPDGTAGGPLPPVGASNRYRAALPGARPGGSAAAVPLAREASLSRRASIDSNTMQVDAPCGMSRSFARRGSAASDMTLADGMEGSPPASVAPSVPPQPAPSAADIAAASVCALKTDIVPGLPASVVGYSGRSNSTRDANYFVDTSKALMRVPPSASTDRISRTAATGGVSHIVEPAGGFQIDGDKIFFKHAAHALRPEFSSTEGTGMSSNAVPLMRVRVRPPRSEAAAATPRWLGYDLGHGQSLVLAPTGEHSRAAAMSIVLRDVGLRYKDTLPLADRTQGARMEGMNLHQLRNMAAEKLGVAFQTLPMEEGRLDTPEDARAFFNRLAQRAQDCGPVMLLLGESTVVLHDLGEVTPQGQVPGMLRDPSSGLCGALNLNVNDVGAMQAASGRAGLGHVSALLVPHTASSRILGEAMQTLRGANAAGLIAHLEAGLPQTVDQLKASPPLLSGYFEALGHALKSDATTVEVRSKFLQGAYACRALLGQENAEGAKVLGEVTGVVAASLAGAGIDLAHVLSGQALEWVKAKATHVAPAGPATLRSAPTRPMRPS